VNFQVGFAASRIIVAAIVLCVGGHIIEVALSDVITTLVFAVIYYIFARRALPDLKLGDEPVSRPEAISLLKLGSGFFLIPAWQAIFFQGTTFIVRVMLGAEAVTLFNTMRTLCRSVSQLLGMVSDSVFPELQAEWATGAHERARRLFRSAFAGTLAISVAGVIFLALFGPTIYQAWTGGRLHPSPLLWALFLIGVLMNSLWWTGSMVQRALNQPFGVARVGFIGALVAGASSALLATVAGVEGAALGSLMLEAFMSVYVLPTSCRMLAQPLRGLFADIGNDMRLFLGKKQA
jgi:O-antigen/teichoic acid export membrane protein